MRYWHQAGTGAVHPRGSRGLVCGREECEPLKERLCLWKVGVVGWAADGRPDGLVRAA